MRRALAQKNTREKLAELGSITVDSSPQAFARMMAGERIRWQQLIREAGIKLD